MRVQRTAASWVAQSAMRRVAWMVVQLAVDSVVLKAGNSAAWTAAWKEPWRVGNSGAPKAGCLVWMTAAKTGTPTADYWAAL